MRRITIHEAIKYTAERIHSQMYGVKLSASVAALELMRIKPGTAHVDGISLPISTHRSGIAYIGHVRPDRNRNITEVKAITINEDSLS